MVSGFTVHSAQRGMISTHGNTVTVNPCHKCPHFLEITEEVGAAAADGRRGERGGRRGVGGRRGEGEEEE